MDIQHLKYFVEVAKQKNFTKASESLHVSQPSISKMIKSLEVELQVTLLDRSERKVELTDAGKVVYDQALKILQMMEDIHSSVNEVVHVKKGTIKMGLMPTLGVMLFPNVLADFKKGYPQIEMQMVEFSGKQLERKVVQGEVDVGITVSPVDSEVFESIPLFKEVLVVIVDRDHWLSERKSVLLSELKEEAFILFTEEYVLHDVVMKACLRSGFEPNLVYKSSLWDIVGEMVAAQFGISVVPKSVANRFKDQVSIVSITSPQIDWELAMIYKKNKYLSYAVREFITYLQEGKT
ncbi:LysR family transcriptional regulator [Viridibacillus sp. FSL R5-0477]|uniref:Transcriptional regulator n=1 Tax=Viridibacillus arenosi FSL R5-213 TaxID=1227360 RepID=W4F334_9BACL|nr:MULTISPECIES: LysR family transcriptional regulator [Viridibacillus]ETT86722.1 transcriptional regulator [Viridibacillus arenosi FSL R5-213]OMC83467.1 LysR family transcriptional regulator [Viridibacillus sp. FSL H8-0123]OMC89508.1 LysR family transcriptional regulator [Viridibacillus arenosi]